MQIHSKALHNACKNLGVEYSIVGDNKDFTEIRKGGKVYHFNASSYPLNSSVITRIARDKGLTYDLLHKKIKMPQTITYIDPWTDRKFLEPFIQFHSHEEIVDNIMDNFEMPVVIKKNQGSQGRNVFKALGRSDLFTGTKAIFNKDSQFYDYAMLAQECIEIQNEYRVITIDDEIVLMYEKDNSNASFESNLSPLHWEGAKASLISDNDLIEQIQSFIKPVFKNLDIHFAGFDIARNPKGEFYLIEINTTIGLDYFVRDNGMKKVVAMYEKILQKL